MDALETKSTVKVELDRGSGILTRKTKEMKKSIGEGRPCPDMMDHNEHSLSFWHCLAPYFHRLSLRDMCSSDSNRNHRNRLGSQTERRGRQLLMHQVITFSHLIEDSPWRLQFQKIDNRCLYSTSLVQVQLWLEFSLKSSEMILAHLNSTYCNGYSDRKRVLPSPLSDYEL